MIPAAVFLSFLLLTLPAVAQVNCNEGMEPIDRDAPGKPQQGASGMAQLARAGRQ